MRLQGLPPTVPRGLRALTFFAGLLIAAQSPLHRVRGRAHPALHPRVVMAPHEWWLAEAPGPQHGLMHVCVNVLTDSAAWHSAAARSKNCCARFIADELVNAVGGHRESAKAQKRKVVR